VPEPIRVSDRVVAAIKWVDETVIDVARQLTLP
jgi:citrate lyase alpha subunit